MSAHHPQQPTANHDAGHDQSDINLRAIIWFVVVLAVIVVSVDIAMWGMFKILDRLEVSNDPIVSPLAVEASHVGAPPPGPAPLQTTPWADLKVFRAEQYAHLHGYGWIDETAGVARVPIDKAKEMLLKKGLPVRPELADDTEGTHVAAGGESNGGRTIPAGGADKSSVPVAAPAVSTPPNATMPPAPGKPGGGQ
jgi:hypothetical protein